jgi:hypothetical protein
MARATASDRRAGPWLDEHQLIARLGQRGNNGVALSQVAVRNGLGQRLADQVPPVGQERAPLVHSGVARLSALAMPEERGLCDAVAEFLRLSPRRVAEGIGWALGDAA